MVLGRARSRARIRMDRRTHTFALAALLASLCVVVGATPAAVAPGYVEPVVAVKSTPGQNCASRASCGECALASACGWCGGECHPVGDTCPFTGKCDGVQVYGQDLTHRSHVVTAELKDDGDAAGRVVVTADVVGEDNGSASTEDVTADEAKLRAMEKDRMHSPIHKLREEVNSHINREEEEEDENPDGSHSDVETRGMIDVLERRLQGLESALKQGSGSPLGKEAPPELDATRVDAMKREVLSRIEEATADHTTALEKKLEKAKNGDAEGKKDTAVDDSVDVVAERELEKQRLLKELGELEEDARGIQSQLDLRADKEHPEDARSRQLLRVLHNRIARAKDDLNKADREAAQEEQAKQQLEKEALELGRGSEEEEEQQEEKKSTEKEEKKEQKEASQQAEESAEKKLEQAEEQLQREEEQGVAAHPRSNKLQTDAIKAAERRIVKSMKKEAGKVAGGHAASADPDETSKELDELEKKMDELERSYKPPNATSNATAADMTGDSTSESPVAQQAQAEARQLLREAVGANKAAVGPAAKVIPPSVRSADSDAQVTKAMDRVKDFFDKIIHKESGKTSL